MPRTATVAPKGTIDPTQSIASTIATFAATETAADNVNFNSLANTGHELLVLRNTAGGNQTVIFYDTNGVALPTVTMATTKSYAFGPFPVMDFGSTLNFDVNSASVLYTSISWNPMNIVTG